MKRTQNPDFDMFVRLKDTRKFPGGPYIYETEWSVRTGKRVWCFNGNKFTSDRNKQLRNLIRLANRMASSCAVILIRDVQRLQECREDENYWTVIKSVNGVVEVNRSEEYLNQRTA